jgi:hypothetical protein
LEKRNRPTEEYTTWNEGGVVRRNSETSKIFLVTVHDGSAETLIKITKAYILVGPAIITDRWTVYSTLADGDTCPNVSVSMEYECIQIPKNRHKNM